MFLIASLVGGFLAVFSPKTALLNPTEVIVERLLQEESTLLGDAHLKRQFVSYLVSMAKYHEFDPLLILAIMKTESSFNPDARSHAGALGLLQVKPIVAREVERVWDLKGVDIKKLMDPFVNVNMGISYLSYLRTILGRDKARMLSGYNVGPTKVKSAGIYSTPYARKVLRIYAQFLKKYSPAA